MCIAQHWIGLIEVVGKTQLVAEVGEVGEVHDDLVGKLVLEGHIQAVVNSAFVVLVEPDEVFATQSEVAAVSLAFGRQKRVAVGRERIAEPRLRNSLEHRRGVLPGVEAEVGRLEEIDGLEAREGSVDEVELCRRGIPGVADPD